MLIPAAGNNGRSAARPTIGTVTGTVRVSTYAMPANAAVTTARVEGLANPSTGTNADVLTITSGYAPGERVLVYYLDRDIGQTVAIGQVGGCSQLSCTFPDAF